MINRFVIVFFIIAPLISAIISCTNTPYAQNVDTLNTLDTSQRNPKIERYKIISGSFLGNFQRNYYGENPPSKLDLIWTYSLGTGKTRVGKDTLLWSGAGWTGQPLLIIEDSVLYLIQGAYDYNLRKINAETGELIWQYKYDDVIKGTGTVWLNRKSDTLPNELIVLQGSRQGFNNFLNSDIIPSYRAISFISGEELWRYNSIKTDSYSRDVDGSALIFNDTAYLGLENGIFIKFNPDPLKTNQKNSIKQPVIYNECKLYNDYDQSMHGGNLVTESSPSIIGDHIYITSGSGHVFGYNLSTNSIDWDFYTGSDIDGSPVVTSDSCIIVSIEKQYIKGKGGIFKLDPSKSPEESVVWFFPTENKNFATWLGGVIGSVGINDSYRNSQDPYIAAFTGIDRYFYIVEHTKIDSTRKVLGPDNKTQYYTPKLVFKTEIGSSISTPIVFNNRIIAASYEGIYLFEYDNVLNVRLLDKRVFGGFESTPVVYNKKVFIACRDGNLYCLGEK